MRSFGLAGDIGDTKTTLAIIASSSGPKVFLEKATFASHDFLSLEAIVKLLLNGKKWAPSMASFGVAGPVIDGQVQTTNLPWHLAEAVLTRELDRPVRLLPFLQNASFLNSFRNKGRFTSFLENIPVHVILNPDTALIGAARYGLEVGENEDG